MADISIQQLCKSYAGRTVLQDVTFDLHPGEKVGLIGANGSGKTTLFKIIAGVESPDSGKVITSGNLAIGYLPQEPQLPADVTLFEAVGRAFDDHRAIESQMEALTHEIAEAPESRQPSLMQRYDRLRARFDAGGGYHFEVRQREILGGLGFSPDEYQQPVIQLSGGQKCRAALAQLLLSQPDYLLLDEPTNHLDIDATAWLEEFLKDYSGGAMIISHDRYLLDRVIGKIIEIENHGAELYPTNYTNFAEAKRIRLLAAGRAFEKQKEWLAHQRDYIDRTRYAKDSAKQARGRQKYLDRMEADGKILEKPKETKRIMNIQFESGGRGGDMVIRCEKAGKAFDDLVLIQGLDFEMTRGEKVGIIGPNGVGKTTLLRVLLGQTPPTAGHVRIFENLSVGYYDQEHRHLDPDLTVLETARQARPGISEATARSFLAMFLFRGEEVFKRVGNLSGGEQSRVLLARLVWTSPHLLILDEPTNHLDIPAREALEQALQEYEGSILMVSHDRYFLDKVATRLLVLPERGRHEHVAGSWSAYAKILRDREQAKRDAKVKARADSRDEKNRREEKSAAPKGKSRSKYAAKRVEEIEAKIIATESRMKELEMQFADPALLKDGARSKQLHEEYTGAKDSLAELYAQWEAASEGVGE